jgi:hypothetical protein
MKSHKGGKDSSGRKKDAANGEKGPKRKGQSRAKVTFIEQGEPIDEYGRALYAVSRSIVRALLDSLTQEDLTDLNCPIGDVTLRQMAKVVRIDRDKGMRGDGFEWAVHEAVLGGEPLVIDPISDALKKASRFVSGAPPTSLLFGYERARYLGFVDAVIDSAGTDAFLLPEGSGRPYKFDTWVAKAAKGRAAEPELTERIRQIWKTDLFLSCKDDERYFAATVKSQYGQLEGGRGLRLGIVPESRHKGHRAGVKYSEKHGLWVVTLPDPNGFSGLFNDAYVAVARAICTLGNQPKPPYYTKPSAKAQRVQAQLEQYPSAKVVEIEHALDKAAQRNLVTTDTKLVSVNAPGWLHLKEMAPKVIAPKPKFVKL